MFMFIKVGRDGPFKIFSGFRSCLTLMLKSKLKVDFFLFFGKSTGNCINDELQGYLQKILAAVNFYYTSKPEYAVESFLHRYKKRNSGFVRRLLKIYGIYPFNG